MEVRDDEIIKALEWMRDCKCEKISNCDGCPLHKHYPYCDELSAEIALDIINRQKAEIERLKGPSRAYPFCNLLGGCLVFSKSLKDYNDMRKGIESEARKEFADRLKERLFDDNDIVNMFWIKAMEHIDNLLAEMEERKG